MILLDTHAVVWMVGNDRRLGAAARAFIDEATAQNGLYISPISMWEIAMLTEKRRVEIGRPVVSFAEALFARPGVRQGDLTPRIAAAAGELTGLHGDPADRMLVATAIGLGMPLLTVDQPILEYAEGNMSFRAIHARR